MKPYKWNAVHWQNYTCTCATTLFLVSLATIVQFKKILHTLPTVGIGISWGMGGSGSSKNIKKCMKLSWYLQRGGEVLEKILPWGRYIGYFLELHILLQDY